MNLIEKKTIVYSTDNCPLFIQIHKIEIYQELFRE